VDKNLVKEMRSLEEEHTSYTIILSPSDADRVFLHSTGANDTFGPEDIDYAALYEADMFHFGYPTAMARMFANDGKELAELLQRAKATGVTTSLDTSMFDRHGAAGDTNWEVLLQRALPYVDIFLPSLDEILLMLMTEKTAGEPDAILSRQLAEMLLDFGTGIVVLKQGEHGLYLRTRDAGYGRDLGRAFAGTGTNWRNRELWAPAFDVSVVGTTGAGDCAVSGFLAAVLRGLGPDEALLMAAAVGACNVESADATSSIRSWPNTIARIESGWKQHEMALPGWIYDETSHVWSGPHDGHHR
jgi:sugar/nucleoside kinase (ribokinase family)